MTPLQFETLYHDDWDELETMLKRIAGGHKENKGFNAVPIQGERVASLYRHACEHLALARARAYPRSLQDRLDKLTSEAHQVIYQSPEFGIERIRRAFSVTFPRAVRAHAAYVWTSAALLMVPALLLGWLVFDRPDLVLSVIDAQTAASFEYMYSDSSHAIGAIRDADSNWVMFGYYIRHNIGIGFQCFALGLFFGIGSVYALVFNGIYFGAIAGYITERGLGHNFYQFVVTHGAFELTAIVLAGAAGMRLGHSLLAPGRSTRLQSLTRAARETSILVVGLAVMLIIAAAIEAFWSSARWLPLTVKYSVAALCWIAVLGYLTLQGRHAD
jgi:uncharacterized membrane protein SpoIIM required for sporulation